MQPEIGRINEARVQEPMDDGAWSMNQRPMTIQSCKGVTQWGTEAGGSLWMALRFEVNDPLRGSGTVNIGAVTAWDDRQKSNGKRASDRIRGWLERCAIEMLEELDAGGFLNVYNVELVGPITEQQIDMVLWETFRQAVRELVPNVDEAMSEHFNG